MELEFLKLQKMLLKGIGLSFDKDKPFFKNILKFCIGFISMFAIIIAISAYIFENFKDLEKLTDALTLLLQGATSALKAVTFLWYRKRFQNMYYSLDDLNKKALSKFPKIRNTLNMFNSKANNITNAYIWACIAAATTAQLIPLIKSSFSYFRNGGSFERIMPYLAL